MFLKVGINSLYLDSIVWKTKAAIKQIEQKDYAKFFCRQQQKDCEGGVRMNFLWLLKYKESAQQEIILISCRASPLYSNYFFILTPYFRITLHLQATNILNRTFMELSTTVEIMKTY